MLDNPDTLSEFKPSPPMSPGTMDDSLQPEFASFSLSFEVKCKAGMEVQADKPAVVSHHIDSLSYAVRLLSVREGLPESRNHTVHH